MVSRRKLGRLRLVGWVTVAILFVYCVVNPPHVSFNSGDPTHQLNSRQDDFNSFKDHLVKMRTFLSKLSNSTGSDGHMNSYNPEDLGAATGSYVEEKQLLEKFGDMFVDIARYVERSVGEKEHPGKEIAEPQTAQRPASDQRRAGVPMDSAERQKQAIKHWDHAVYVNYEESKDSDNTDSRQMLERLMKHWDPFSMAFPTEQAQDRVLRHFQLPDHVLQELSQAMAEMSKQSHRYSLPDPVSLNAYTQPDRAWKAWHSRITQYEIYDPKDPVFKQVLKEMNTSPIDEAYEPSGGTQQKLVFYLETGLRVIFKPMRFPRKQEALPDHMFWRDYERHFAEIAAFHLDRVFGFHRVPPVVGRYINVTHDVKRFADEQLRQTFFRSPAGNICFYGSCQYYCDTAHAVCGRPEILEGSVMAYLPTSKRSPRRSWRHPWRRSYSKHHQRAEWQDERAYCEDVRHRAPYNTGRRLLDLMDMAVFDFLMGNMDRHHYETFEKFDQDRNFTIPILFDNGRGFGKSAHDELSILAPIYQCCLMRYSTLQKLLGFQQGGHRLSEVMRASMSEDVATPILTEPHLQALDRRVGMVLLTVHTCVQDRAFKQVVIDDGV